MHADDTPGTDCGGKGTDNEREQSSNPTSWKDDKANATEMETGRDNAVRPDIRNESGILMDMDTEAGKELDVSSMDCDRQPSKADMKNALSVLTDHINQGGLSCVTLVTSGNGKVVGKAELFTATDGNGGKVLPRSIHMHDLSTVEKNGPLLAVIWKVMITETGKNMAYSWKIPGADASPKTLGELKDGFYLWPADGVRTSTTRTE